MKKSRFLIITILIIIAVCTLALTACGGGTPVQKKLGNGAPWITLGNFKEVSVYDVTNTNDDIINKGKYTVEISRLDNKSITIGEKEFSNFTGYYAFSNLVMENGDTITSKVITQTTMKVVAAETTSKISELNSYYFADYGKKAVDYVVKENGKEVNSNSIKIKDFYSKPFTDNTLLYLLTRCLPSGGVQFGIYIPDFKSAKLEQVVLNRKNEHADFKLNEVTYKSTLVEMAYNRTFPGIGEPIKVYISEAPILGLVAQDPKAPVDYMVDKAILSFVEKNTVYNLTDTRLVEVK